MNKASLLWFSIYFPGQTLEVLFMHNMLHLACLKMTEVWIMSDLWPIQEVLIIEIIEKCAPCRIYMKKQLFSDYRCFFPPLKLSADFSLLQLSMFGWSALFYYNFIQRTTQELGKPSGTCMFGSGWEGGCSTVSMTVSSQHLVGTYVSVLVLQRQPQFIEHLYIYLTIPRNAAWTPIEPWQCRKPQLRKALMRSGFWPLDQKIPVYILSLILLSGRDASLEDRHGWPGNKLFQQTSASSWPSFAQAKHPLVSPNRRCSETIFIATEKIKKHFEGIEMEKGSLVSQVCLACMKPWGQSMHLK